MPATHTVHNPGFDAAVEALAIAAGGVRIESAAAAAAAGQFERCMTCKAKKNVCMCNARRTAHDMAASGSNARTAAAATAEARRFQNPVYDAGASSTKNNTSNSVATYEFVRHGVANDATLQYDTLVPFCS